jgi:hypothetical protein
MISPILKLAIILIFITTITLALFFVFTRNKKYLILIKKIINYSMYVGIVIIIAFFLLRMIRI